MKKKRVFAVIAAAALSAAMCMGLAACGENGTESGNGTTQDGEQVKTYEVAAERWAQIMDATTSFTIDSCRITDDDTGKHWFDKIDGDKYELNGTEHQIVSKEGNTYYVYGEDKSNARWDRTVCPPEDGKMMLDSYRFPRYFREEYTKFTYENGAYTAAEIENEKTLAMGMKIKNVTIRFENGAVVGMEFEIENYKYELKDVGKTTINLPQNYIDAESDD